MMALFGILALACGGKGAPYLGTRAGDVVVATVERVENRRATNGNPPRVTLRIHEVLRGDPMRDRTNAIWEPTPNGFDFGDPAILSAALAKWEKAPLESPKVGAKFVLWGECIEDKDAKAKSKQSEPSAATFAAWSWNAYPYSEEKRAWAVDDIRKAAEERRQEAERRAAEKRALEQARAKWREKTGARELREYSAAADLVIVGRISSEYVSGPLTFKVTRRLKGTLSKTWQDGEEYFSVTIPSSPRDLLDRESDYLLFLKTVGMKPGGATDHYPFITKGDGIVVADAAALEAVRVEAKRR